MAIDISCPSCFATYRVKDEIAGRNIKCRQCGSVIPVRKSGRAALPAEESPWADDDDSEPFAARQARRTAARRHSRSTSERFTLQLSLILCGVYLGLVLLIGLVGIAAPPVLNVLRFGGVQIGMILSMIGTVACMIAAFREDTSCGMMWLFVPFYAPYYMLSRFADLGKWVVLWGAGGGAALVGVIFLIALNALPTTRRAAADQHARPQNAAPQLADRLLAGTPDDESQRDLNSQAAGVHRFTTMMRAFPPQTDGTGSVHRSWQTSILPYIGKMNIYNRIDWKVPWDDPANLEFYRQFIPEFQHAHISETTDLRGLSLSHYAMNQMLHRANGAGMRTREIQDGYATTFLLGEVGGGYKTWGDPSNVRDLANGLAPGPESFGNPTGRGAWLLLADGSVRWFNVDTDSGVLRALSTPNGGEPVQF